ncbi:FecR domain-containing protein [Parapedobacter sp. ISTM3]|uniref:FecR family protein n=1 Tax=Parapedobacter sp. ISTM3 TaxID=2800130 RepID=UPI0019040763|nr:FecR family protein [Parapedobacter sp. ISTM3]MBK1438775.1 FecR domain-containing protein [Parapedobacter sp. ISTM3]
MEQDIKHLFERYLKGECSADEIARLYAYFGLEANEMLLKAYITRMLDSDDDTPRALAYQARKVADRAGIRLQERLARQSTPTSNRSRRVRWWLPYAAAVVIFFVVGWLMMNSRWSSDSAHVIVSNEDIPPAANRAILTLADGRSIDLSEAQSGIVVGDGIRYLDGSAVSGLAQDTGMSLSTPKGGTYQITLPDGSNVWLNSASTLKYPKRFDDDERVVELEGEAYFSVAQLKEKTGKRNIPFKVLSAGQVVEVLGTEFNISSYKDEPMIETTLVEGSVRVVTTLGRRTSLVLAPGEQASLSGTGVLNSAKANLKKELAWQSGIFYFEETSLVELMRQVSRWYDVDIQYVGDVPQESYSGLMSRYVSLKTLLEFLNESSAQFTLRGRTVIIQSETY